MKNVLARRTAMASSLAGIGIGFVLVGLVCITFLLFLENSKDVSMEEANRSIAERRDADGTTVQDFTLVQSVADLQRLLGSPRSHERELVIRSLLAESNKRRTKEILRISDRVDPTTLRSEIQLVVVQKLATLDPRDALAQIAVFEADRWQPLVEIIFAEWASSNLEKAVLHAQSMNQLGKRAALTGILRSRSDLSEREMSDVARRLGNQQLLLDHLAEEMLARQFINDPRSALDSFLLRHGRKIDELSDPESRLLSYIVQSWIDRDGADAILSVNSQLKTDANREAMLGRLFSDISDDEVVLAIARSVSNVDLDIVARAIAKWAETDPVDSLGMASSFNDNVTRTRLQKASIVSWSRSNPKNLLSSLATIPKSLRDWSHSEAMYELARYAPEKAANELERIPNGPKKKDIASIIARNWAERDPRAAFDWVQSNPEGSALTSFVLQGIVISDPQMALDMALGQPLDENGVGFEAEIVGYLAKQNVDRAIGMLNLARNPKTLKSFYHRIGPELIRQGKSTRAMELVQGESEDLQTSYYRWIVFDWIRADAQDLFAKLDDLPNTSIQRQYSELMLAEHRKKPFLDEAQVAKLKHYGTSHTEDDEPHTHD